MASIIPIKSLSPQYQAFAVSANKRDAKNPEFIDSQYEADETLKLCKESGQNFKPLEKTLRKAGFSPAAQKPPFPQELQEVDGLTDLNQKIARNRERITIIVFSAEWCRPCKALKPKISEMVKKYGGKVQFIKVDIDKHRDIARRYAVRSIPQIIMVKNGNEAVLNEYSLSYEIELALSGKHTNLKIYNSDYSSVGILKDKDPLIRKIALKALKGLADAWDTKGNKLYRQGKGKEAFQCWDMALKLLAEYQEEPQVHNNSLQVSKNIKFPSIGK